ncbi:class I SAM-dependent methyltransferase [Candidatus Saganbacteria bacterium]|nr:class I SAM-dependent methyltransferase [Candidatus Saganbacteria bacterium]
MKKNDYKFTTIYSLENLGAILSLVGFKNATIVALDISASPLEKARAHFGRTVFGFPVEYVQGDALALPFDNDSFDLVTTHLFMTHIADQRKNQVLAEAGRVLRRDREFIDEEIVVPPGTDLDKYKWFYATLADEFPGTPEQKAKVAQYMVELGAYSEFYPYGSEKSLVASMNSNGFEAHLGGLQEKRLYVNVCASLYQINARKV